MADVDASDKVDVSIETQQSTIRMHLPLSAIFAFRLPYHRSNPSIAIPITIPSRTFPSLDYPCSSQPFDSLCHHQSFLTTPSTQRLKSALWYSIGTIIDAISLDQDLNATPHFIGALTELVWSQILTSGADLEAFAKYVIFCVCFLLTSYYTDKIHRHAGRETVDVKDVLLLVRRNEQLKEVLEAAVKEIKK